MSTKTRVLEVLYQQPRAFISGEDLAAALGLSRAAVWKAVHSLKAQGIAIESVAGQGYRILAQEDVLCLETLRQALQSPEIELQFFDELDSTNRAAKEWALAGAPHGSLLVAARQTAGRGRLGRSFLSPQGGLYMSILLRPREEASTAVMMTAGAAVAVCRAVASLSGIQLGIKWVNDLFLQGKKCCGILTEAGTGFENASIEYMVLGIGINVTTTAQQLGEHADVATSLAAGGDWPVEATRAKLAAAVYHQVLEVYGELGDKAFLPEYRDRSIVLGRQVRVLATPVYEAEALEIDQEARLIVREPNGCRTALSYGEISIKLDK